MTDSFHIRKRFWVGCLVVLVISVLLLLRRTGPHSRTASPSVSDIDAGPSNSPGQLSAIESRKAPAPATTAPAVAATSAAFGNSNGVAAEMLTTWQAPIEFYGRVVDENKNAVTGAKVRFHWVEVPTPDGNREATTESDADGLFSLQGARGPGLTVSVSKEDYYTLRLPQFKYGLFSDGNFSADPRNPVVFSLRKKGHGADLITSANGMRLNVAVRVPRNNTPVRLDFFQKQASADGQLEISQYKPPSKDAVEWSFRISIPDGGLVENEDEFSLRRRRPIINRRWNISSQKAKRTGRHI